MTILSTESIAGSSSSPSFAAGAVCARCRAPLAADQRYCLECGERQIPHSELLFAGPPGARERAGAAAPPPSAPPGHPVAEAGGQRSSTLTVIAGVGVLLLAMGVGVLIGRSGASKQSAAPPQVISVASAPAAAGSGGGAAAAEPSFTGDWPAGTGGYTVQLQTLPESGTTTSAVAAAKSAASAKGAKDVGALKSEEFSSLTAGSYVIYAGIDHSRAEAEKALGNLKKSFPGAKVIKVSNGASGSSSKASESSSSAKGAGSSEQKPAPPSVLEGLKNSKGKSYEEKSKNLPNVVSTG